MPHPQSATRITAPHVGSGTEVTVSLAADAPRVEQGTERYEIDADGQTVYA